ncbi:MAG: hypothetical protein DRR19_24860 [Candidatus Parabeggiatoa sp. nov. 1]|nr:MAG: hypothetical protein DRR19_24860 [Gammaproteobacteria bacterium]
MPDNSVHAVKIDSNGGLWIGTSGGLAYLSKSGEWTIYTTDNSGLLFNNNVLAITVGLINCNLPKTRKWRPMNLKPFLMTTKIALAINWF